VRADPKSVDVPLTHTQLQRCHTHRVGKRASGAAGTTPIELGDVTLTGLAGVAAGCGGWGVAGGVWRRAGVG
jgi:hypothetical protein